MACLFYLRTVQTKCGLTSPYGFQQTRCVSPDYVHFTTCRINRMRKSFFRCLFRELCFGECLLEAFLRLFRVRWRGEELLHPLVKTHQCIHQRLVDLEHCHHKPKVFRRTQSRIRPQSLVYVFGAPNIQGVEYAPASGQSAVKLLAVDFQACKLLRVSLVTDVDSLGFRVERQIPPVRGRRIRAVKSHGQ